MQIFKRIITITLLFTLLLSVVGCGSGTSEIIDPIYLDENLIDSKRAMDLIRELSSEAYEGRQAGSEGNEDAEDYLSQLFKEIGLESPETLDNYKQEYIQVAAQPVKATEISVVDTDFEMTYQVDFTELLTVDIAYHDVDFTGKMNFIYEIESLYTDIDLLDNSVLLIPDQIYYKNETKGYLDNLFAEGINIEGIIIPEDKAESGMRVARGIYKGGVDDIDDKKPVFINCSDEAFDVLKQYAKLEKEIKISMDYEVEEVEVANIVGFIQGKNEVGEDKTLIIGAHMDHVGNNYNGTYNPGALDNASGISVMMEIARVMKASEQPEDTVIFIAFNGEEDGLLGSQNFLLERPVVFDMEHTKMLNLDMVGSSGDEPLQIGMYKYPSSDMRDEIAGLAHTLDIDYVLEEYFGGSDHVNFSEFAIPSVMLIHFDKTYYHTYQDTVDNAIDRDRLEDVIRLSISYVNGEVY